VVVHYCGSNDIAYGYEIWVSYQKVAENAIANTRAYVEQLEEFFPEVRVLLIGVISGPTRHAEGTDEIIKFINAGYHTLCTEKPATRKFVDLNPALSQKLSSGETGQPLHDLYLPDGVHYHPNAYEIFRDQLKPMIQQMCKEGGRYVD